MPNPKHREALKVGSPKPAAPNINCACESCGKLVANEVRENFLGARTGFFAAAMWRRALAPKTAAATVLRKSFRRIAAPR
jgi:hypothetical protein